MAWEEPELTDQSLMPFGAHMSEKMENVPAQYLLWLWEEGVWRQTGRPIHDYIASSFSALEKEVPDFIVKHRPEK